MSNFEKNKVVVLKTVSLKLVRPKLYTQTRPCIGIIL